MGGKCADRRASETQRGCTLENDLYGFPAITQTNNSKTQKKKII